MYVEDVIVHLSSAAAARVGYLSGTFELARDPLVPDSGSGAVHALYGHRVEVLPSGWIRVHVSRHREVRREDTDDAWCEGDVWLAPSEVIAITRVWNASDGPPGGKAGWEASWGTRRGEGQ